VMARALVATLLFASCSDEGSAPPSGNNSQDQGSDLGLDQSGQDLGPDQSGPDLGVDLGPDQSGPDLGPDQGRPDLGPDQSLPDLGEDMPLGPRTCPEDLRDSCIFTVLACFGGAAELEACVHDPRLNYDEAVFKNGSGAEYRIYDMGGQQRREFRTRGADGAMCFRALAEDLGEMPKGWTVTSAATGFVYKMTYDVDTVTVVCPGDVTEVCSRSRFDLFFEWPDTFPEPMMCPDKDPAADQCSFDASCGAGSLCCRPDANSPKQCLGEEFCLTTRPPVDCETSEECGPGRTCSRCARSGRECVPEGLPQRADNGLACVPDSCDPGDAGACQAPRVCCQQAGAFRCSVNTECDSPPDQNPVCAPTAAQPCQSATKSCCFVSELNQFRCIDQNAVCRTNVCFNGTDCASGQSCCDANQAAGIPGTCLTQCAQPTLTCMGDGDCGSIGGVCCRKPGYTVGFCGLGPEDCRYTSCDVDPNACPNGESCCGATPLSEDICVPNGIQCPPPAF
jgi:hypothetical protein